MYHAGALLFQKRPIVVLLLPKHCATHSVRLPLHQRLQLRLGAHYGAETLFELLRRHPGWVQQHNNADCTPSRHSPCSLYPTGARLLGRLRLMRATQESEAYQRYC
jgi:hypothetical protein